METDYGITILRLFLAMLAGAALGLERTYHGRPAGFRTHTLVCMASALLMQFTVYQWNLLGDAPLETVRVDPTRMAQGIMTGIGFLGAGVIIKEGLTVRGLTTAASIWMTASIGIVIGMGMYVSGFISTLAAGVVLSLFRWIEHHTPTLRFARLTVCFKRAEHLSESALNEVLTERRIESTNPSYYLEEGGKVYRHQMTIRTLDAANFERLAETLNNMDKVVEFSIRPTGD